MTCGCAIMSRERTSCEARPLLKGWTMNRNFVFTLIIVLAVASTIFGLIAEAVHYREGQGVHVGHIARAFTATLAAITIMLATRSASRRK